LLWFGRSPRHGPARLLPALGVGLAIVIAVAAADLLLSARSNVVGGPSPSASATPFAPASRTASPAGQSPGPTPTTRPPTMSSASFITPGLTSGWTGFTWTSGQAAGTDDLRQVLRWRGGYVATESGTTPGSMSVSLGLWTSPDGETWTPVTAITDQVVLVSVAPVGLVAIGLDTTDPQTPATVQAAWASSDGTKWQNIGKPNLPGSILSIAGTDAGIVATVNISDGSGNSATPSFLVEFSTDGVNWTPETVGDLASSESGWGMPPHVQSNDGHFYLMGTAGRVASLSGIVPVASVARDEMWLSDDGRSWTQSSGGYPVFADYIDFGREGMILHTNAVGYMPGGTGLAYSTDGGKTWHDDDIFGPLGQAPCQGECAVGPDGVIGSNGTAFVAVKNGGKKAWISYDGHTWTPISWNGPDPAYSGEGDLSGLVVLPRGVGLHGMYGAGR